MAIIDTLKLARALHDRGGFSQEAADATAEALNAALGEDVATKADITGLKADIKLLDGKITLLMWAVGINAAATLAGFGILWQLATLLGRVAGKVGAV